MRIPLAIQSYRHRNLSVSAQRLINWYPEAQPQDAKAQLVLLPTAGTEPFVTLPDGPVRGVHAMGDRLYVVAQINVYRIDEAGNVTDLGPIDAGGPVSMADNGIHVIMVVPETRRAWVATRGGANVQLIDHPDFGQPISVTVLNGFAVFVEADSGRFFYSEPNDALDYDATSFATAEGRSDNLLVAKRASSELWLFGEKSTEIWNGVTQSELAFGRVTDMVFDRGCASATSVAAAFGTVFWLGDDRCIYSARGFQPERISTPAIAQAFNGYSDVRDAVGWCYEQEGHEFYCLAVPGSGTTWVYDRTTQAWHERQSEGYDGWRCITGVNWAGGVFAGDATSGRVWRVSTLATSEGGALIRRQATGIPMHSEARRLFMRSFALEMQTGLAPLGAPMPRVGLCYSDDGGQTFTAPIYRDLGATGEYRRRLTWRSLGAGRERVFRVLMSDAVGTALIAANIEAQPGLT